MNYSDYAALEGVRWSDLRHLLTSPLLYRYRATHPQEDTPAMVRGRATHCAVLEPDQFPLAYTIYPGRRAGKKWEEFRDANEDKTILRGDEYDTCLAIRDAVRGDPVAGPLLTGGASEMVITWRDGGTSLPCKARVDYYHPDRCQLIDLKTTTDPGPRFAATCARMYYHYQLAHYRAGLIAPRNKLPVDETYIIAAQSVPPHDVVVYRLPDELMDWSARQVGDLMRRLKKCQQHDRWHGYAAGEVINLDLPLWAYPDDEDESVALKIGGETYDV